MLANVLHPPLIDSGASSGKNTVWMLAGEMTPYPYLSWCPASFGVISGDCSAVWIIKSTASTLVRSGSTDNSQPASPLTTGAAADVPPKFVVRDSFGAMDTVALGAATSTSAP